MSLNNKQLEKIALETYVLIRTDLAKQQQGINYSKEENKYLIYLVNKIIKILEKDKISTPLDVGYWKEILDVINRLKSENKTHPLNSLNID